MSASWIAPLGVRSNEKRTPRIASAGARPKSGTGMRAVIKIGCSDAKPLAFAAPDRPAQGHVAGTGPPCADRLPFGRTSCTEKSVGGDPRWAARASSTSRRTAARPETPGREARQRAPGTGGRPVGLEQVRAGAGPGDRGRSLDGVVVLGLHVLEPDALTRPVGRSCWSRDSGRTARYWSRLSDPTYRNSRDRPWSRRRARPAAGRRDRTCPPAPAGPPCRHAPA